MPSLSEGSQRPFQREGNEESPVTKSGGGQLLGLFQRPRVFLLRVTLEIGSQNKTRGENIVAETLAEPRFMFCGEHPTAPLAGPRVRAGALSVTTITAVWQLQANGFGP